jgi:hypothetical protein
VLEHGQRRRLHLELHPQELAGEIVDGEHRTEEPLAVRMDALGHAPGRQLEVVVHDVEVPRLVVRLARRRHLGLERLEPIGELRGDLPRRELPPEDGAEHAAQGFLLLGREVDAAVALDGGAEDVVAVPGEALPLVVDGLHPVEPPRVRGVPGQVEHPVGQTHHHGVCLSRGRCPSRDRPTAPGRRCGPVRRPAVS